MQKEFLARIEKREGGPSTITLLSEMGTEIKIALEHEAQESKKIIKKSRNRALVTKSKFCTRSMSALAEEGGRKMMQVRL